MFQNKHPAPPKKPAWASTSNLVALACAAILVIVAVILLRQRGEPVVPKSTGPTLADQVRKTAQADIDIGQDAAARDLLAAYCRGDPKDTELALMLAQTLRRLGQATEAELTVLSVLKQAPQMSEALWLNGELIAARGGKNAQKYFELAATSPQASANPEAGRDIWAKYALHLLEAGQDQQARQYMDKAAAAGLADARTAYGFGVLAYRSGQFDAAQKHLAEAARLGPGNPQAWLMLAGSQRQLGQLAQARASLQEGIARCLDKSALLMELGKLELADGKPAEAGTALASACHYAGVRAEASLLAARAFFQAGQFAQAMKYADIAAAENPPSPEIAALVAQIEDARFSPTTKSTFQP